MSRFTITLSLVVALSSAASAGGHFAHPPRAVPHQAELDASVQPAPLDRVAIRSALARAREINLAAFRAYVSRGVFPSNTYQNGKLHVWRDAAGHLCAAATIIRASGQVELVDRVAEENNFIALIDVRQGPLMDWMLTSGFTQEEIDAIQMPALEVRKQPVEPARPAIVDADKRKAEDVRLKAGYSRVDRMLVEHERQSLDLAVERVIKHARLASTLSATPVASPSCARSPMGCA